MLVDSGGGDGQTPAGDDAAQWLAAAAAAPG
jgi:hypothetical protein